MIIPFIIGKASNGNNQLIDLAVAPLLMLSYCNENQLRIFIQQLNIAVKDYKAVFYFATNSKRLEQWDINKEDVHVFLKDDPIAGNIMSRKKLLDKIITEIRRRKRILGKKKITSFKRYHELNLWNEVKLSYNFFVVDDVWDMVISKPKSLGLDLMNIMLNGPAVGINTIIGSEMSQHNLLAQLVNLNPKITTALQEKYGIPEPKRLGMLGAELTFTTEDFIYFRSADSIEFLRLFGV